MLLSHIQEDPSQLLGAKLQRAELPVVVSCHHIFLLCCCCCDDFVVVVVVLLSAVVAQNSHIFVIDSNAEIQEVPGPNRVIINITKNWLPCLVIDISSFFGVSYGKTL